MLIKSTLVLFALMLQSAAFAGQELTFTNKEINGSKVWEPSATTLKAGEDVEIKLVNTLKDVHGFEVPGLTEKVAVPANETKVITVKAPKSGDYKYTCFMHPKHIGGSLKVQ
ncbi:MAG: cupredoxin domain-containing protein [Proteobacteria bacterium]|nr:cupredoxin domain-containing protein [Pseudomonadota bacterium]